jgi:DUF4097 and DUF4098 domain-containing protein YvlB
MNRMKLPILATVVGLGMLGAACTVTVDSHSEILREEKRFSVTGIADLRLTTFDGSIQIQSWDKPDILVEIEKRGPTKASLGSLEVIAEQKGNRIDVEVKRPASESFTVGFNRSPSANLVVSVPRDVNIVGRTGDGSIKIERVTGRIDLRTGDGSIRANEVAGELRFDTSDGSVAVQKAQGRLSVDTGDGSVDVGGTLSAVKLHTGDGSVVYRAEQGSTMSENWDITTGDGSVSLYLPRGFGAELDAHTGDGSIRSDIDGLPPPTREESRRSLKGRIGDGGKLLRIRTGDGAIQLGTT